MTGQLIRTSALILFLLLSLSLKAQEAAMLLDDFFATVKANHPLIRRTQLLNLEAEAYQLKARGAFDPKLKANYDQKSFDGKDYFRVGKVALEVPTWYGLELKAGYNWADGVYLNPEEKLPSAGQAVLAVNVNLLQGMLIDERRATLRQAQIMSQMNEQERKALVNDILMEANQAYWNWVFAYNRLTVYEEAYRLAQTRNTALVESFEHGYKAAVDTLESSIQVQNRFTSLQEVRLELESARLELSNYLWTSDDVPLQLPTNVPAPNLNDQPIELYPNEIDALSQQLTTNHPALQTLQLKLDQLSIQDRYYREMLKPKLQVSYNLLADGFNFNAYESSDQAALGNILTENYKVGVKFSFPIFLRKERANISLNQIKVQDTNLKLMQKRQSLQNKFAVYVNTATTLLQQIEQYDSMVSNYRALLAAENDKFRLGSSSLFLINSREQKLIESTEKLLKAQSSFLKTQTALRAVAGVLAD